MTSKSIIKFAAACILFGAVVSWHAPAIAGSDNSSDTYAGDYTGGSLPTGTFIFLQYAGFAHSNSFVDTTGHGLPNSHANIFEEFTRATYFTQIAGHPFVIEAELPAATLTDVNIPGTNNLVAGGLADPVLHFTYFLISDALTQRWLGLTNYVYLPMGSSFDNQKAVNVATANQFTDVPQIGYTEGLGKFSPALKGLFFDLIANASFHTDGSNPINFSQGNVVTPFGVLPAALVYDKLTQSTSYDVKAFLRYEPKPFTFVALGIEKSWGGEQIATNGRLTLGGTPVPCDAAICGPRSLSKDDYLRGHLQAQMPLAPDFAVAADVFHDFARVGGFKDDIGVEIRLTKFFFPMPPSR
jgi:hypothetical protein